MVKTNSKNKISYEDELDDGFNFKDFDDVFVSKKNNKEFDRLMKELGLDESEFFPADFH